MVRHRSKRNFLSRVAQMRRRLLENAHEYGTTVTRAANRTNTPGTTSSSGGPLVCVVDDDRSLLRALRNLLMAADLQVETFVSADEFLQSDAQYRADCLLLDLQMPGLSGGSLLLKIRESGSDLPVIMLTAHGDEQTRQRCLDAGATAFLSKPFAGASLLEEIRLAIAARVASR